MSQAAIDWLGWIATAVFVGSYLCRTSGRLRMVQMAGSILWILYGAFISSMPVVASNALVLAAAAWTLTKCAVSPTEKPT
jgi:hypothetical protein